MSRSIRMAIHAVSRPFALVTLISLSSCATPAPPARISHIVFIKLDDSNRTNELIADSRAKLGAIPQVASLHVGRHLDVGRGAIDDDYDMCISLGFDTVEDYRVYVDHPLHVQLVEYWRERWEWIRVHDVLDEEPSSVP